MFPPGAQKDLAHDIARLVHLGKFFEAAGTITDYLHVPSPLNKKDPKTATHSVILPYVRSIMEAGALEEAAQIFWTPTQFSPEPESVKQVWQLFESSDMGLIVGAASMGKSFSMGVRLFLEWVRDPSYTTIRVIGPSQNHLEANLFSHLVSLHTQSTLPMPGEIGELFIGMTRRDQLGCIRGVIIPKGNLKKAGRLQGSKRRPRATPHPIFGTQSRMFIFLDEIENVARGVWADIDNILSNTEESGQGFKIFGAYNPSDPYDEVSKRAEPEFGWPNVDPEVHFRWKSKRGWQVLRLDAEKSENVVQNKIIFPGLQTRGGLEKIAANAGGRQSAGYYVMGRGMYPPMGVEATVIPAGMLAKARGEYIWFDEPVPVGATDLALEGGDEAIHTLGKWGLATGIKWPPSIDYPQGHTVMFKREGSVQPRWALQVTGQFILPKGDTIRMKAAVLDINRKAGVRPEYYACDRTGHGAGVADLLKYEWSTTIHDVNYSAGASEEKIMQEDSKTCKEQYERMFSELWFATRLWLEFQYLLFHPSLDMSKIAEQLANRRFRVLSGRSKVESKSDYESRGFKSPNDADSLTLLVHAARKGSGQILSMRGDSVNTAGNLQDDWYESQYPGGCKIDPSNKADFLDTSDRPIEDMNIPSELLEGGWT